MIGYRDKLEIDIRDMAANILKAWKWLALAAVVGAIIGGVYGLNVIKQANVYSVSKDGEEALETIAAKLSTKEKSDVEMAFRAYKQCEELYDFLDKEDKDDYVDSRVELVKATQQLLAVNSGFTQDQRNYYSALIGEFNTSLGISSQEAIEDIPTSNNGVKIMVKYVVFGAFTALFMYGFILAFKYLLSSTLKTINDMRNAFDLPVIGTIQHSSDVELESIYRRVIACTKNSGINKLYLGSSSEDSDTTEKRNAIGKLFVGKDVEVHAKGNMLTDPVILDEISSSEGVVLVETIGKSKYEDIAREIELCKNVGIPIIGAVVIERKG